MNRTGWKPLVAWVLAAVAVHALAVWGVAWLRGSAAAYAYQSPDSAEFVSLARGLAWEGRYVPVDSDGARLGGPDTWRTPGYPALLALWIRLFGDGTGGLLVFQQMKAVAAVPLFWLLVGRYAAPRWALLATAAWCIDPFRIYYSLWLMTETLFVLALLVGVWIWSCGRERGWSPPRAIALGAVAGAVVLIRPIGLLLPLLAAAGVAWDGRRDIGTLQGARGRDGEAAGGGPPSEGASPDMRPQGRVHEGDVASSPSSAGLSAPGRAIALGLLCLAASTVVTGSWVVRNRIAAGHWGLSHQSGASFAYHKAVDVVLRSEGRSAYRFDAEAMAGIREDIDRQLRAEWQRRHGPLSAIERDELRWEKLNFGATEHIDGFEASSLLWSIGLDKIRARPGATAATCFTQGLSMLAFPLGLVMFPPAGEGAAPLSMLGGGTAAARAAALLIGLAYAALAAAALWRLTIAVAGRRWTAGLLAVWPAAALFLLSLPSEDPRFRLPIVPLLWILAISTMRRRPAAP